MNLRAVKSLLGAIGAFALMAGCTVGPNFVQPDSHLPQKSFSGDNGQFSAAAHVPAPTDPLWWNVFRDPVLTSLERRVAEANLDVQTATLRLAESRFQRGAVAQFPSLNSDNQYQREQYSKNGIVSLIGGLVGPAAGTGFAPGPINEFNSGFDASWERISGAGYAGRSKAPTPRSIRPRTSAAMHWSRPWPNLRGTTCSFAACRPRSRSPTTI